VLFGKYSGTEIKVEDEDYLILREDEILAKLSGAAKAAGGRKVTFPSSRHGGCGAVLFENQLKILRRRKTHGKAIVTGENSASRFYAASTL